MLNQCQVHAAINPTVKLKNNVDTYVTNCDNVNVYSNESNISSNVSNQQSMAIMDGIIPDSIVSNYLGNGSSFAISIYIKPQPTSVFLCIFSSEYNLSNFLYPHSVQMFKDAIKLGDCSEKGNNSMGNNTMTISRNIALNNSGYFFIALASEFGTIIAFASYNLSLTRKFYNQSDYTKDWVSCFNANCQLNITYPRSCVMLYANSGETDFYNYVEVIAEVGSNVLKIAIPIACIVFIGSFLYVIILLGIIYYQSKPVLLQY